MNLSLSTNSWPRPLLVQVLTVALVLWPFAALILLRRRTISPAVTAAALFPMTLALALLWRQLAFVSEGASRSGGGGASVAAGIAESMTMIGWGVLSSLAVLLLAAMKRHWPAADRMTIGSTAAILLLFLPAIPFAEAAPGSAAGEGIALLALAVSLAGALTLSVWFVMINWERVAPRPVRFGTVAIVVLLLVLFLLARHQWTYYRTTARTVALTSAGVMIRDRAI